MTLASLDSAADALARTVCPPSSVYPSSLRASTRRSACCLLAALAATACGGDESEDWPAPTAASGAVEQALTGEPTFIDNTCNAHRSFIRQGLRKAREALDSSAMLDCLRQAALYDDTTFAERVWNELRQNYNTRVSCKDLGDPVAQAMGGDEGFFLNTKALDAGTYVGNLNGFAGLILHEVAHTKGYGHLGDGHSSPELSYAGFPDHRLTVPLQVTKCAMDALSGATPPTPHGQRRDGTVQEAILTPVGGGGGRMFERACLDGYFMRGMDIFSGFRIDALQPLCAQSPLGETTTPHVKVGGSGGSRNRAECGPNGWVVGAYGAARDTVDILGLFCASTQDLLSNSTTAWQTGLYGGDLSSYFFERRCPPGMAVRGIKGRTGNVIERLELECEDISPVSTHFDQHLIHAGRGNGRGTLERCPGRSAVTALTMQSGALIDRLGGRCGEVVTTCRTKCIDGIRAGNHLALGPHGGWGGGVSDDACKSGFALIGMEVTAGDYIDSITGRCGNVNRWSQGLSAEDYLLPRRGGFGGSPKSFRCPQGLFVAGWKIVNNDYVNELALICRDF